MKKIILASSSPRRKELLELTGLRFKTDAVDCQERMDPDLEPHRLARFLSCEKAKAAAKKYDDAIIIAADTFIVFRGRVLGKPRSNREAVKMLELLNGKAHSVITGFTIIDAASRRTLSRTVETKVWFKTLTRAEIDSYVRTGEPLDKAGAYGIQGLGSVIVKKIEGDCFNVIGLPLSALMDSLKRFGVYIL